ncbi:MAG: hypothetical protein LUH07_05580, partial [Lachnospiraceae bacterium]|nr:hypothetical protein [Lachnospiraceae bacterium]
YKIYEYDSEWNLLTLKVYGADSTLTSCSLYEYDESGKLISVTYNNANGEITGSLVYDYNDLGQITMASNYSADGNATVYTIYEYDENGNQIQYSAYSSPDSLIFTTYSYLFDEEGNPTQTETYSASGELYSTYLIEEDEDGNQRETIAYYTNGKVSSTTINLYNSDGFYLGHGEATETQDSYYNEYGAVAFINRDKYKDFEDYSEEEQKFISAMVEAAESGDMDAMTDLLELSGDAIGLSYTMWNGYKISVIRSYNVSNSVIAATSFEIRSENGMGYYVSVEKNTYSDDDENNPTQYYVTEWDYTTCPCVDWQWNGELNKTFTYTTTTEGGYIGAIAYYEHTEITSGAMLDNLRDGVFSITDTSIYDYGIGDTSGSSFSYTITYEDGALVDTDNKETFGSYLSSDGTTWISVFDDDKGKLYTLQGAATDYYDREALLASSWLETLYW